MAGVPRPGNGVRPWGRRAAAAATGLLLFASFPPLEWSACAWVALVPLGWAVAGQSRGRVARLALLSGAMFWVPTLAWVRCVTWAGWIVLAMYCALYSIPMAWAVARFASPAWRARLGGALLLSGALAASWAGWEALRGWWFTGFPWNFLGVSQYRNLALLQHAEWGGVAFLSAVVAWVNGMALSVSLSFAERRRTATARLEWMLGAVLVAALLAGGAGMASTAASRSAGRALRLGLVQPAIPQYEKWTEASYGGMLERFDRLSRAALALQPDLLVWPETALPEIYGRGGGGFDLVGRTVAGGVPLLFGALDSEADETGRAAVFNAAILAGPGPETLEVYRKQHLVLFGEYVPFRRWLPWLGRLVPMDYDLSPGARPIVFRRGLGGVPFAVLICFEDTIPELAIRLVREGARLLFVLTNDAWFDGTWGHRQHLIQCVPRAVETRRPVVRCANSGVTCWIDALGRIGGERGESGGALPVVGPNRRPAIGFLTADVPSAPESAPPTFMVRRGPVVARLLAIAALALTAGEGASAWRRRRGKLPAESSG